MIAAFSGIKIHLCTKPIDMRRGSDGLNGMVTTLLEKDPRQCTQRIDIIKRINIDQTKVVSQVF